MNSVMKELFAGLGVLVGVIVYSAIYLVMAALPIAAAIMIVLWLLK